MFNTHSSRNAALSFVVAAVMELVSGCQGPSAAGGPVMVVEEAFLSRVPEGEAATSEIVVRNAGDGPLTLFAAELEASAAWRVRGWPAWPAEIAPGGRLALALEYVSTRGEEDAAVWIESDDPDRPRARVALGGLALQPAAEPLRGEVEFGAVATGGSARSVVRIANGGSATLAVRAVALEEDTSGDFSFEAEGVAALAPGEWFEVVVTYRPTGGGRDAGALRVETDDPRSPVLIVPLRGEQAQPAVY